MNNKQKPRRLNRRNFLKLGTGGVLLAALGGGTLSTLGRSNLSQAAPAPPQAQLEAAAHPPERGDTEAGTTIVRLATTDGFMSLPGRRIINPDDNNGVYVFGFTRAEDGATIGQVTMAHKGQATVPSPILDVYEDDNVFITITNIGFEQRPDLDDAHTIHWHGFRNPTAVFDGVPELSISVPVARDFPYYFKARGAGTYMYHCHFEDVEHVQMGMDGIIFIRPSLLFSHPDHDHHAYNDIGSDTSTYFNREYTLLFNEIDTRPHDQLLAVQEFVWSDFKPNYWLINGRSYPDTLKADHELALGGTDLDPQQPISSLIQALPDQEILLRMGHLGYQQQAIQLLGIPMTVVGHDASFLDTQSYTTNTIYIGPGENRDVIIKAPLYSSSLPGGSDDAGNYNVYWLKNRNYQRLVNGDDSSGLGGMMTQVRVYDPGSLNTGDYPDIVDSFANQDYPNQTIPNVPV